MPLVPNWGNRMMVLLPETGKPEEREFHRPLDLAVSEDIWPAQGNKAST